MDRLVSRVVTDNREMMELMESKVYKDCQGQTRATARSARRVALSTWVGNRAAVQRQILQQNLLITIIKTAVQHSSATSADTSANRQ